MTSVQHRPPAGPTARRPAELLRDIAADPRRALRKLGPQRALTVLRAQQAIRHVASTTRGVPLAPDAALRENGFTICRGLFDPTECATLAAAFMAEAGIVPGAEFTRVDATNKLATARRVLFDQRIRAAVQRAIAAPPRFLQVSDLHYRHDTAGWHRDSVHRALDSSAAPDWDDGQYGVVKVIVYLETDDAAMGLICGSHLSPRAIDYDLVRAIEKRHGQLVLGPADEPNRCFSAAERAVPLAWLASVGDVLIFDERLYHAGRRVTGGRVTADTGGAKLTLSLVFGPENHHSRRLHSYFRYARRELHYKDFPPAFRAALAEHDLLLGELGNYYLQHPEELRLAHLRHPEKMNALVAQFRRAGGHGS